MVRLNGDLTSSGRQRFTPAQATTLERATRYYVVIEVTSLGSTQSLVNAYVDYKRLAARPTFIAEPGWAFIWSDEETMWVLDGGKDSLFAYRLPAPEGVGGRRRGTAGPQARQ